MKSNGLISRGLIAVGMGLTGIGVAAGAAHADPIYPVPPPPVPPPAPVVNMAAVAPAVPVAPAPPAAVPAAPVVASAPTAAVPSGDFATEYVDDLATNGFGNFDGYVGPNALAMGYAACGAGLEWDDQVAAVKSAAGAPMSDRDAKFIVQSAHIYLC